MSNICENLREEPVIPVPGWNGTTTGFPPLEPVNEPEMGLGVTRGLIVDWPGPGVGMGVGMLPLLQSGIKQHESAGSVLSGQDDTGYEAHLLKTKRLGYQYFDLKV